MTPYPLIPLLLFIVMTMVKVLAATADHSTESAQIPELRNNLDSLPGAHSIPLGTQQVLHGQGTRAKEVTRRGEAVKRFASGPPYLAGMMYRLAHAQAGHHRGVHSTSYSTHLGLDRNKLMKPRLTPQAWAHNVIALHGVELPDATALLRSSDPTSVPQIRWDSTSLPYKNGNKEIAVQKVENVSSGDMNEDHDETAGGRVNYDVEEGDEKVNDDALQVVRLEQSETSGQEKSSGPGLKVVRKGRNILDFSIGDAEKSLRQEIKRQNTLHIMELRHSVPTRHMASTVHSAQDKKATPLSSTLSNKDRLSHLSKLREKLLLKTFPTTLPVSPNDDAPEREPTKKKPAQAAHVSAPLKNRMDEVQPQPGNHLSFFSSFADAPHRRVERNRPRFFFLARLQLWPFGHARPRLYRVNLDALRVPSHRFTSPDPITSSSSLAVSPPPVSYLSETPQVPSKSSSSHNGALANRGTASASATPQDSFVSEVKAIPPAVVANEGVALTKSTSSSSNITEVVPRAAAAAAATAIRVDDTAAGEDVVYKRGSPICGHRKVTMRMLIEYFRTGKMCGSNIVIMRFGIGGR